MPDSHKNFAYSTVATAPSPATSGTSLIVAAGDGAKFPTPPFNATIWPTSANPLTTNAEIVRVTAISTDTLTIVRTQESTSARTVVIGDQIAAAITARTMTDAEVTTGPQTQTVNDVRLPSNAQLRIFDDPYVIVSGTVFDLTNSNPLLWCDSTVVDQFQNQLLEPSQDQIIPPGWLSEIDTEPLILDSGRLVEIKPTGLLWLNAAACPRVVSTLLIIGV